MRNSRADPAGRPERVPRDSVLSASPNFRGEPIPWRRAWKVLASSVLFPGNGHLRTGQYLTGILWSLAFAGVFFPAAVFAFILGSTFLGSAIFWLFVSFLAFGALCGLAPAISLLRASSRPVARREAPRWLLWGHASFLVLLCALELACFLGRCICPAMVRTSALEPMLSRGDAATVIVSRYVRPVHGNIVLMRAPPRSIAPETSAKVAEKSVGESPPSSTAGSPPDPASVCAPRLARVLAKPEDSLEARKGHLLVNGVETDLGRTDQRKILEKAGRAEKRRRMLSVLHYLSGGQRALEAALPGTSLAWEFRDWGPQVLPRGVFFVLPDMEVEDFPENFSSTKMPPLQGKDRARTGFFISRSDILGRVVE